MSAPAAATADPLALEDAERPRGARRTWTRERIARMLDNGSFAYQRIELPFGLATPGEDRRPTADLILPTDLGGKTLLDLGCNHGYFCFEALRRGATRAVGYDHSPAIVRRANRLAEIKGLSPEISLRDLDREGIDGEFDYVLCLNALHHFDNPLLQLERMMAATREVLVLEIAGFGWRDCFRSVETSPLLALCSFLVSPFPVMLVGRARARNAAAPHTLKYYFTRSALRRVFAMHRDRFPRVDIIPSPFKSRFLLIARRSP